MNTKMSRRSLLVGALSGAAVLTIDPLQAFADTAAVTVNATVPGVRPTVIWVQPAIPTAALSGLWPVSPDRLTARAAVGTLRGTTQQAYVSPDRFVQLSTGRMLSLVAAKRGSSWQFGVVSLVRVAHEGWHEATVADPVSQRPLDALGRGIAVLQGQSTSFSLVTQAVTRIIPG